MRRHIELNNNPQITLDIYIKEKFSRMQKLPMVVVCPGGAFLDCSENEGECVALNFVGKGYHAAVLTYSTKTSAADDCKYPKQLEDLAAAVCFIRENAEDLGVDENKIAILGFSAGGYICAMYSSLWNHEMLSKYGTPQQRKVNAAILCYPLTDTEYHHEQLYKEYEMTVDMQSVIQQDKRTLRIQELQRASDEAFYGHYPPEQFELRETNPILHICQYTAPTFIWQTFSDSLISPIQSMRYAKALHKQKIPCELHIFENGEHGISLADKTSAKKKEGNLQHVAHWTVLAQEWLDIHFEKEKAEEN